MAGGEGGAGGGQAVKIEILHCPDCSCPLSLGEVCPICSAIERMQSLFFKRRLTPVRGSASVLKYLRADEWTMGNGQCHDCYGLKPRAGWWTDTVGHRHDCKKAKSIEALGGKVVWEQFNHSRRRIAMNKFFAKVFKDVKTSNNH
jgi:hypothetical protein